MQLQDMVTRIRKTLGEPEPNGYGSQQEGFGSWDNSQIIGYLNEALGLLAHDWRKEASATVTLVAGQVDVPIPVDSLEDGMRRVMYASAGVTHPTSAISLDEWLKISSQPDLLPICIVNHYRYAVWDGNIKLLSTATLDGDQVTFYYYRNAVELANGNDIPEIPERFHIALVQYAIAECQNSVEESNLESDAMQKWEMYRAQFKMEMSRNQRDRSTRVRGRRN